MAYSLLLESIEKQVSLTEKDKEILQSAFTLRKVKKGQFLVHKGAVERNQLFIASGSAITYFTDLDGNEHIIQFGIEGWWVSDLQSFLFQKPATCSVEALEDSEVLEASYDVIQKLYDDIPMFERYHRIITQHGYAAFQLRMLQNLSMSAEDRYKAFLEKYRHLELRFPQKIIASYLGMSPEFFSKLKKRVHTKA